MFTSEELFDLEHSLAKDLLKEKQYPWEVLPSLSEYILTIGPKLEGFKEIKENVWVHPSASIAESTYLNGPCIIGANSEVRHCAYIRGSVLVGENCVIGNSTELKNVIIFDNVQVPHYNYVGDSILGYRSHMGAGSITSNVKSDKSKVVVKNRSLDEEVETGLKKFGAMIGDYVEIGCNAVLNPGTVIGRNSSVYPLSNVRGVIAENSIVKSGHLEIVAKES